MRRKYKIGQKVQYRTSRLWITYEIYSIQKYKGWRICYNIFTDDEHQIVEQYQIKKVKKNNIWFTTWTQE